MCSGFLKVASLVAAAAALAARRAQARELRVCADPNNLPFSNERGEGFENRIVDLVAEELGATVEYTWWAQRRGFLRNTLKAGLCDLVPGMPSRLREACARRRPTTARPTSSSRAPTARASRSFDDPRPARASTIGVQLIGDDGSNTPPAHALARRGIVDNVRGYTLYGDYASRTRRRASSTRWRRARSTSRSSGGRWPATSRTRQPVPLQRHAGAAAGRRAAPADGRSTSRWACARRTRRFAAGDRRGARPPPRRDRRDPRAPTACRGSTAGAARGGVPMRRASLVLARCAWRSPACEREERDFRPTRSRPRRRRRSRSCRCRPARPARSSSDRGKGQDYEDNAYHLSAGQDALRLVQLHRLPRQWRRRLGPAADGRPLDLRRRDREHRRRRSARAGRTACRRSGARSRTTRSGSSPPMCAR